MNSFKRGYVKMTDDPKFWYIQKKSNSEVHSVMLEAALEHKSNIGNSAFDVSSYYPGQVNKVLSFYLPEIFRQFVIDTLNEYRDKVTTSYYRSLSHIDFEKDTHFGIPNRYGYTMRGDHGRLIFRNRFEYTPLHVNYGQLHFTYWVQVPFTQNSEAAASPNPTPELQIPDDVKTQNGSLYFAVPVQPRDDKSYESGRVDTSIDTIYLSERSEGVLCIYPNYLFNGTNPFYSSKKYLIECTGAISFLKPDSLI